MRSLLLGLVCVAMFAGCARQGVIATNPDNRDAFRVDRELDDLLSDRSFRIFEGPQGHVRYSIVGPDGRVAVPRSRADEVLYFHPEILRELNLAITDQARFPSPNPTPLLRR